MTSVVELANAGKARLNAVQIFHINFNCSDLDRSRAFYELLGFEVVNDFSQAVQGGGSRSFAEIGLAPILNLPADCDARAILMALTDDSRATRLDLIEWVRPRSSHPPKGNLAQIGFGRFCLKVRDCQVLHDRLVQHGHVVYSPPVLIEMGGTRQLCFCCEDPDGIVVEFMQFLRDGEPAGKQG